MYFLPIQQVIGEFGATVAYNEAGMDMGFVGGKLMIGMGVIRRMACGGSHRWIGRRELLSVNRYLTHVLVCNEFVFVNPVLSSVS